MMTYVDRFRALADELSRHPDIQLESFEVRPPAPPDVLATLPLTPAMRNFYAAANGLVLRWTAGPRFANEGHVVGRIDLIKIEDVFGSWEDVLYFEFDPPDSALRLLKPIDAFVEEARACLRWDGSANPKVVFHGGGSTIYPLEVDFNGYLELLLRSRGLWYWQKAIAAPELVNEYAPMCGEEKVFWSVAPRLFPNFDPNPFRRLDGYVPPGITFHAHPSQPPGSYHAHPSQPPAVGAPLQLHQRVIVRWSNNQIYQGLIEQVAQAHALIAFPNGQRHWVGFGYIMTV